MEFSHCSAESIMLYNLPGANDENLLINLDQVSAVESLGHTSIIYLRGNSNGFNCRYSLEKIVAILEHNGSIFGEFYESNAFRNLP